MDFTNVTIGLAFLAGLASFLSPCVFSLVPAYVGYLGGRAAGGETTESNRFITFTHGLAFVLGFSFVFIALGVATSTLGHILFDLRYWLAKTSGVVVSSVEAGSAAESAGLQRGDVIQEVNHEVVKSLEDYQKASAKVKKDEMVVLLLSRQGNNLFVAVNPK